MSDTSIHNKDNQPHYDYYFEQRLKYKDDERLLKYIEFSKIFDDEYNKVTCYNSETMLFTIHISTPISFQGVPDFNSFDLEFFPYMELGSSWSYSPKTFIDLICRQCVKEGEKQKGKKLANFFRNL